MISTNNVVYINSDGNCKYLYSSTEYDSEIYNNSNKTENLSQRLSSLSSRIDAKNTLGVLNVGNSTNQPVYFYNGQPRTYDHVNIGGDEQPAIISGNTIMTETSVVNASIMQSDILNQYPITVHNGRFMDPIDVTMYHQIFPIDTLNGNDISYYTPSPISGASNKCFRRIQSLRDQNFVPYDIKKGIVSEGNFPEDPILLVRMPIGQYVTSNNFGFFTSVDDTGLNYGNNDIRYIDYNYVCPGLYYISVNIPIFRGSSTSIRHNIITIGCEKSSSIIRPPVIKDLNHIHRYECRLGGKINYGHMKKFDFIIYLGVGDYLNIWLKATVSDLPYDEYSGSDIFLIQGSDDYTYKLTMVNLSSIYNDASNGTSNINTSITSHDGKNFFDTEVMYPD